MNLKRYLPFAPLPREVSQKTARTRILIWTLFAGLLFGAIGMGRPIDLYLQMMRDTIRQHPASGDIVVVAIDDRSMAGLDQWPWPRRHHAAMIDKLIEAGARRVLFDIDFSSRSTPADDMALEQALARSGGRITLAAHMVRHPVTRAESPSLPLPAFRRHATLSSITHEFNFMGWASRLPYAWRTGGVAHSSFAARLANASGAPGEMFDIDFSIDPRSVPTVSAIDLLKGDIKLKALTGKDVLVGTASQQIGDHLLFPGHGSLPGVYLHALGAETLKAGRPGHLGWLPAFAIAALLVALALQIRSLGVALGVFALGILVVLAVPLGLDARLISSETIPALFLLIVSAASLTSVSLRQSYRVRGTVNPVSGLLNLDALRQDKTGQTRILIAARVHNYAQIASALPADEEQALVQQIANRLTLGTTNRKLYQGDEGIFAWFSDQSSVADVGQHLDALHGFFRNSLVVADSGIDLTISFGVETASERSPTNRLGSALVAADEAAAEGLKWKAYDPAALEDASWKLSLLGQLDRAIDNGDLWVAYQPKLDLITGTICGAEALARWTHPEKGPIAPLDFILAAEQSDRIGKLTRFVLDRAIGVAAEINAYRDPFNIAVNLSTRLVGDASLPTMVADLLRAHGLAPRHLTLEITETAALGSGGDKLETLQALRDLGVGISIDDYGTGLSTLEYLKKIPANEIKIDQSFVMAVTRSHSDRLMVHSTIQLVHSLGHHVVAEGVEDRETLNALVDMGCDYAQGFFIGRPMTNEALTRLAATGQPSRRTGTSLL